MDRLAYLKAELGVGVYHEDVWEDRGEGRQRYELPDAVHHVNLGLTPVQWCALAMRDPDEGIPSCYVGGCCGNMSYVQDIINGAFRDGGSMSGGELLTVGQMMRAHDDSDDESFRVMTDEEFVKAVELVKKSEAQEYPEGVIADPWWKIGVIFNGLENVLTTNALTSDFEPERYREDYPEDKKILNVVESTLRRINWGDLFSNGSHGTDEDFGWPDNPRETEEQREQRHRRDAMREASHAATRTLNFAKLLGPVRRLHELMESREDVFEGWALVDPTTYLPIRTGQGEAFFWTQEDAEWLVALWERTAAQDAARDIPEQNRSFAPEHRLVRVEVSVEGGMKILGGRNSA